MMSNAVRFTKRFLNKKDVCSYAAVHSYALLLICISTLGLTGCSGLVTANNTNPPPALTISGVQAATPTTTGFQVSWSTSLAANSTVDYGTTASYGSSTATNSSMVTSHQVAVAGLSAGTLYHFRVKSTDAANANAASPDMTFATAGDTTPPTVAITAPTANATISGVTTVSANAADNVGVTSVQFKVDNANTGAAITAAPYNYSLNTSTLSNGNHIVTAVASDAAGNTATSAGVAVKVSNTSTDTTPPTVSLTAPANGATVSGPVTISANAADNVAVASVQFKLDGANLGAADTTAPYSLAWDSTKASNGAHTLSATATDTSGNTASSANVSVTVSNSSTDTTPPTVSITAPANGATVSGTVSVTANASDNVGVASVQFQLDSANLGVVNITSPYSVSWNTTTATNASHTLRAIAKDAAGNSTTSTVVTVTVNNAADTTPPSVPAGLSATAISSSQINLSWTASTDNVGVTGYNIFRAGVKIATAPSTVYQDAGLAASTSYTYSVSAFDAAGNTSAQSAGASATTQTATSGGGLPSTLGWYPIPNTKISPLCPQYPEIQGASGCAAVVAGWGGALADTNRNRFVVWGGGHTDYFGNEVYALDLNANPIQMILVKDSTHGTNVTGAGSCPESYLDGSMSSRHDYSGMQYLPKQDLYFMFSGSKAVCGSFSSNTWTFSPKTVAWQQYSLPATHPDPAQNGSTAATAYDSVTDQVYDYEVNTGIFWSYSVTQNNWTLLSSNYGGGVCSGTSTTAAIDPVRRLYLCTSNGWLAQISLNAPYTGKRVQGTGCNNVFSAPGTAIEYDPINHDIVLWSGGNTIYNYDPDTDSCTSVTYSGGPAMASAGQFNKFRFFPALGVFVVVVDVNQNAYALRLSPVNGGGSGPSISGVSTSSITTSGATVTWTTDVAATSQVEYGPTTAYGNLTTLNSSLATSHSTPLAGLITGTLYHYRIHSKNSSGVESISGDFAFQTANVTDTTPPTISISAPTNTATVSGTVTISANASDNVGVTSVQFFLDGASLGLPLVAAPYSISWDSTSTTNGAHTLTAQARDAAGNVGNAVAVGVTVTNSTSTALQDFQTRCAQTGVIVCQGFDDPAVFAVAKWPASGLYPSGGGNLGGSMDTTIAASGAGSLKFTIPSNGPADSAGVWRQLFQSNLAAGPSTAKMFGANSTFYLQFRQRFSIEYLTNNWVAGDGSKTFWKQQIMSNDMSTCGNIELTTVNWNQRRFPTMYTQCGADGFVTDLHNGDYLLEQADASGNGYNCHYQMANNGANSCFIYPADTWVTFYYKVSIGTWGQPNSSVQAWVSVGGGPYVEWINGINHSLFEDSPAGADYDMVTLLTYMTNRSSSVSAGPTAYTWYDELIVSGQPIAAPNN
jgi:chitodextrinase